MHGQLEALYGKSILTDRGPDQAVDELVDGLIRSALQTAAQRPAALREVDRRREVDQHWYQSPSMIGYVAYVDRFAGTLAELPGRLDHLAELGVRYLHLMPLLAPRPGANDGGYAVQDHREIDPRLGTMADLEALAAELRGRDMSLCIDLVLNHTAREHPWAKGWLAGREEFADFYFAFPDRTTPDSYEETINDVFPQQAPGSFSWVPEAYDGAGGWVWTSFFDYQWDLNWANPRVFAAVLDTVLWLANRGVEIFRLDAVPFMWKRMGTSCINQPEVHELLQALHALVQLAAPGTAFKAEAIVAPDELVPYLGGHKRYRPECELAYHNQLMVMLWSALATKDARLAVQSLRRMRPIPDETSWATYVRCHDDIGWAVSDLDARASGTTRSRTGISSTTSTPAGSRCRSPAVRFFGENPETGDARISGSAAALCGISDALDRDDAHALELGVRRLVLLHAVTFAWGGVPLIYMGDELAQGNDESYLLDPALADDNRWMHRPFFDEAAAARRHDPETVPGRIFGWLVALGEARRQLPALHAAAETTVLDVGSPSVLGWRRRHPRSGWFIGLANVSEHPVSIDARVLDPYGELETVASSDRARMQNGELRLPGLGFAWLAEP